MKSKITNIRIVAKDKDKIIFEGDMGKTADIVYKIKDPLTQMEGVMLASYPNSLIRTLGGIAGLLQGVYSQKTIPLPAECEELKIDILILSEGNDNPDSPQIKCAGCAIIRSEDTLTLGNTDLTCIGMSMREAIGAIHLIEMQQLISSAMNSFLQQMMMAQQQARAMGGPGGLDLRNINKKPRQ